MWSLADAGVSQEPISVGEANSHLRLSGDDEFVVALIPQAREWVERYTSRLLVARDITLTKTVIVLPNKFRLPYFPINSIISVKKNGADIAYERDGDFLLLPYSIYESTIVIEANVGENPTSSLAKRALLEQMAILYEHRGEENLITASRSVEMLRRVAL